MNDSQLRKIIKEELLKEINRAALGSALGGLAPSSMAGGTASAGGGSAPPPSSSKGQMRRGGLLDEYSPTAYFRKILGEIEEKYGYKKGILQNAFTRKEHYDVYQNFDIDKDFLHEIESRTLEHKNRGTTPERREEIVDEIYQLLKQRYPHKMDLDSRDVIANIARKLGEAGIGDIQKQDILDMITFGLLNKKGDSQQSLKEDLGAGSNQAYSDKEIILKNLQDALKILNNPQAACTGWHTGVKKAEKLVQSAAFMLNQNK